MAHDESKKADARRMYVFDRLSLNSIAIACELSYSTVLRWKSEAKKNGDDWDKVKSAYLMSGGEIEDIGREILTGFITEFRKNMELLQNGDLDIQKRVVLLSSLSDSYSKAVASSKKLLPETNHLAIAIEVLERLTQYIQQHEPDLLLAFSAILQPFGQVLEKELGKHKA